MLSHREKMYSLTASRWGNTGKRDFKDKHKITSKKASSFWKKKKEEKASQIKNVILTASSKCFLLLLR